ncbi:MAG: FMN-binding protein [Clostridia bacterium]|nr:FMN-binding protein [Clostridia bacterium]
MENNTPKKKQFPAYVTLTIIAVIAAVVLAATNQLTKGPIAEHEMAALKETFGTVMPAESYEQVDLDAAYTDDGVDSLYKALDADGNLVGYCVKAAKTGYANSVAVTLGVNTDGTVAACVVGDTNFQETETLGGRWKKEENLEQFKSLSAVDGGSIEALSGATVTSKAVLGATNAALKCVAEVALNASQTTEVAFGEGKTTTTASQPALTGEVHTGTAKGFASDVTVSVTLDENNTVTGIRIDASGETAGFGQRTMEDADYQAQFIGKTLPLQDGDVDVLSGATFTSNAVVEAVNAALEAPATEYETMVGTAKGFGGDVTVTLSMDGDTIAAISIDASSETPGFGQRTMEDADYQAQFIGKTLPVEGVDALSGATITSTAVVEAVNSAVKTDADAAEEPAAQTEEATAAPVAEATGTPVTGTAKGFASDVTVTATVDDGVITSITIDASGETAGFGQRTMEDADYQAQFIGKTLPLKDGDVDVLSGATFTSNAVVEALNSTVTEEATEEPAAQTEEATAAPVAEATGTPVTGTAKGFASDVTVTATVDGEVITSITIDASGETAGFGQRTMEDADYQAQFIGKTLPLKDGDVDALSGATFTSNAVVEALNSTVPASMPEEEEGEAVTAVGEAQGFTSTVTVTATLDSEGKITAITIDASGETPGFGQRTMEDEDFQNQFIGKTGPFTLGENVDALTGATITSTAVVEALNNAAVPADAAEDEATATDLATATDAATATDLPLEAEADGFASKVKVTVTLDADGAITDITVDASGETAGFGQRTMEDEDFLAQFIGKKLPLTLGEDVDALSGATLTSTAIVEALNSLVK